jgi:mannose-6-phosphate isomerase-like protein (cupin superfamily)
MSYAHNAYKEAIENENFRKVLYTGEKSQLVIMCIPPGGEIGTEVHPHVEQTLMMLSPGAVSIIDGQESELEEGAVIVVTPGAEHNVVNRGEKNLKIITVYTPANHIDGRIHASKADADADTEDEAFGESVK